MWFSSESLYVDIIYANQRIYNYNECHTVRYYILERHSVLLKNVADFEDCFKGQLVGNTAHEQNVHRKLLFVAKWKSSAILDCDYSKLIILRLES